VSAPAEPFDRTLPSPIASVLELRASARDSVVVAGEMTALQERMLVATDLEQRLLAIASSDAPPAAVVISGSAGGGKSAAISRLAASARDTFADIVEDATHAEAPDQEQYDRLIEFFAPLADTAPPYEGPPLLIAMNTGMVIRFFDQVRAHGQSEHEFTALEAELRRQLALPPSTAAAELPGSLLVVNLDLRATSGGEETLFPKMLATLDPDLPGGIMGGAPRCATCAVRDYCFVRTNAVIVSSEPARTVLDDAADAIALGRGRPLQPRELWDLAAEVVTGGETFSADDPCDTVAELAARADRAHVWRRLAVNGAFIAPLGATAIELAALDPSYRAGEAVHELMISAGIDPAADGDALVARLGGDRREAVATAAAALASGEVQNGDGQYDRAAAGRGLVRAAALVGEIGLARHGSDAFAAALAEYASHPTLESDASLGKLQALLATALVRAFGVEAGLETFFYTRAYDPRHSHAVLVAADLLDGELLRLRHPDPARVANADGAEIAGYRPLAVVFDLAGVEVRVDLPLYGLLEMTAAGTKPSSADLERFFGLRRAAEALGRVAAADRERALLIAERQSDRRFRIAKRRDVRGDPILGVQEVL
jgi:hypothetical protein